jgi:hypothetical protein
MPAHLRPAFERAIAALPEHYLLLLGSEETHFRAVLPVSISQVKGL